MLAAAVGGVSFLYTQRITAYQTLKNRVDALLNVNLKMRKHEQSFLIYDTKSETFMATDESENLNQYMLANRDAYEIINSLKNDPLTKDLGIVPNLKRVEKLNAEYYKVFINLSNKIQIRGFKGQGLEGNMRKTVHALEDSSVIDLRLILTLRRHEKDFIIRRDLTYVQKLDRVIDLIKKAYPNDSATLLKVENYQKSFKAIVRIEEEIGLNENVGLRGKLNETTAKIDQELVTIKYLLDERVSNLSFSSSFVIIGSVVFMLLISLGFAFYFSYSISMPITALDRITKSVVNDLKNQEKFLDKIRSKDEIGSLSRNFKIMLLKLKHKIAQAQERSDKLEKFAETEAQRNWHNEGLTIFNEIFRSHYLDLERQSYEIISQLVKYTNSNQGGIFIVNRYDNDENTQDKLELTACYAYERRRYIKKTVKSGEGLIGTAWREKDTILITDVPQDYVKITSGLGNAKPNCLLIVPIKNEEEIEGVIELVSFKQFSSYEIEFIEVLSQKIATAIVSIKANERTKQLLVKTEKIAQEAQEREAELKKQITNYEHWVQQFERKLNRTSEESLIFQSIIGKIFDGFIITDERFVITKINNYVARRFKYPKTELIGQSVDVLIETDYQNIINLRDKKIKLSYRSFQNSVSGKVLDHYGKVYDVEMISGKLKIEDRLVYVFLFNEYEWQSSEVAEKKKTKTYQSVFG